jgi:hypothetical protein
MALPPTLDDLQEEIKELKLSIQSQNTIIDDMKNTIISQDNYYKREIESIRSDIDDIQSNVEKMIKDIRQSFIYHPLDTDKFTDDFDILQDGITAFIKKKFSYNPEESDEEIPTLLMRMVVLALDEKDNYISFSKDMDFSKIKAIEMKTEEVEAKYIASSNTYIDPQDSNLHNLKTVDGKSIIPIDVIYGLIEEKEIKPNDHISYTINEENVKQDFALLDNYKLDNYITEFIKRNKYAKIKDAMKISFLGRESAMITNESLQDLYNEYRNETPSTDDESIMQDRIKDYTISSDNIRSLSTLFGYILELNIDSDIITLIFDTPAPITPRNMTLSNLEIVVDKLTISNVENISFKNIKWKTPSPEQIGNVIVSATTKVEYSNCKILNEMQSFINGINSSRPIVELTATNVSFVPLNPDSIGRVFTISSCNDVRVTEYDKPTTSIMKRYKQFEFIDCATVNVEKVDFGMGSHLSSQLLCKTCGDINITDYVDGSGNTSGSISIIGNKENSTINIENITIEKCVVPIKITGSSASYFNLSEATMNGVENPFILKDIIGVMKTVIKDSRITCNSDSPIDLYTGDMQFIRTEWSELKSRRFFNTFAFIFDESSFVGEALTIQSSQNSKISISNSEIDADFVSTIMNTESTGIEIVLDTCSLKKNKVDISGSIVVSRDTGYNVEHVVFSECLDVSISNGAFECDKLKDILFSSVLDMEMIESNFVGNSSGIGFNIEDCPKYRFDLSLSEFDGIIKRKNTNSKGIDSYTEENNSMIKFYSDNSLGTNLSFTNLDSLILDTSSPDRKQFLQVPVMNAIAKSNPDYVQYGLKDGTVVEEII